MRNDLNARADTDRARRGARGDRRGSRFGRDRAHLAQKSRWRAPTPSGRRSSSAELAADAERALADGNYRAALTIAGRSAAINPAGPLAPAASPRARRQRCSIADGSWRAGRLRRGRRQRAVAAAPSSGGSGARTATGKHPGDRRRSRSAWRSSRCVIAAVALWPRDRALAEWDAWSAESRSRPTVTARVRTDARRSRSAHDAAMRWILRPRVPSPESTRTEARIASRRATGVTDPRRTCAASPTLRHGDGSCDCVDAPTTAVARRPRDGRSLRRTNTAVPPPPTPAPEAPPPSR